MNNEQNKTLEKLKKSQEELSAKVLEISDNQSDSTTHNVIYWNS